MRTQRSLEKVTDVTNVLTMEKPKPKRRHRSPHGLGQFVTDVELVEWLGLPERDGRLIVLALDQNPNSRFPKKQEFWGGRRWLPAVEKWLEASQEGMLKLPPRRE